MKLLTKQEVFDKVYKHLLTQNKKSMFCDGGDDFCAYRGADNTSCAAGCLILDEHYSPELEKKVVRIYKVRSALLASGVPEDCLELVTRLQIVHDCNQPQNWQYKLSELAKEYCLTIPEMYEV